MNHKFQCPVCGAEDFDITVNKNLIKAPYGPEVPIEEDVYVCRVCRNSIDYSRHFESKRSEALQQSNKESVETMLEFLSSKGHSWASIERSLDLPQRTISRWKSSAELSSVGMALLRIIRTYPWILDVAERKFESGYANWMHINTALNEFMNIVSSSGYEVFKFGQTYSQNSHAIGIFVTKEHTEQQSIIWNTDRLESSPSPEYKKMVTT